MSKDAPIQILVRELSKSIYYSQLESLQSKLNISSRNLTFEPLSRRKKPSLTYKINEIRNGWIIDSWVVKFSPKDKQNDPWYDVYKEFHILEVASTPPAFPVPKPIHCSSEAERRVVGTKFIIMSFVEGNSYPNASSVPLKHRGTAFSSVMKELARIHGFYWTSRSGGQIQEYTRSDQFWQSQVTCWQRNYDDAARTYGGYGYRRSSTDSFFDTMSRAVKRSDGEANFIHGDMDISNVIFDDQFNVKAIVDWKWDKNGDPMVDVAYFCMMFLRPEDYGYKYRVINDHPLLIGYTGLSEDTILSVYKRHCQFSFKTSVFYYAKAVCALRLLSILKAAIEDNFRGHESGEYDDNRDYSQLVMDCLTAAGEDYYKKSRQHYYE